MLPRHLFALPSLLLAFITQTAPAEDLQAALASLAQNQAKIEGYQATYQAKSTAGQKGIIQIGIDFKSGWSYLISELYGPDGQPTQSGQQWSTANGRLLIQSGDQLVSFADFGKLAERANTLRTLIAPEDPVKSYRTQPFAFLDQDGLNLGINHATHLSALLPTPQGFAKEHKDGQTIALQAGPLGTLTMDAQTGTLISQTITNSDVSRTLTRSAFTLNPGPQAISDRFLLDPAQATPQNLDHFGMGQKLLRRLFQEVIDHAAAQPQDDTLPARIASYEDGLTTFLTGEALNRAGFIKDDFLFPLLDRAMAQTTEKLRRDHKEMNAAEILTNPDSRTAFILRLAETFARQAPASKKDEYLGEVFGPKLRGEKGQALAARALIETMALRAYYRVRLGRSIDAYVAKLKDR